MLDISKSRHYRHPMRPGLGLAALGLALGLGYGLAAPSPAAAAPSPWRAGCQFKSIPGGAAEGIRYDACMHQRDCQNLANAAGRTIFEAGCFGVAPDTPPMPETPRAPQR